MKKCSLFIALLITLSMLVVPASTKATAPMIDQMCGITADPITPNIGRQDVYQTFIPTLNTLDAVGALIWSNESYPVKIRVLIYDISSIWNFRLVVNELSSVDNVRGHKKIDIPDTHLDPGRYALSFKAVHENDSVKWLGTHRQCYPNGNAIIDDENLPNTDMVFYTYSYDSTTGSSGTPDESSVSDRSGTADDSVTNDDSSQSSQSGTSGSTTGSSTSSSSASDAVSVEAPSADTPGVNTKNNQVPPMSDEELAALITWIKADAEANRSHGIFGISGIMGRYLTWPVVIGVGAFILLLIVVGIILLATRRKSPPPPPPAQPATQN
jgi:hypothetical protein